MLHRCRTIAEFRVWGRVVPHKWRQEPARTARCPDLVHSTASAGTTRDARKLRNRSPEYNLERMLPTARSCAALLAIFCLRAQSPITPQRTAVTPAPPGAVKGSCGPNRLAWISRWETMAPQNSFGPESETSKRGRAAFQTLGCSSCHGSGGDGASALDLLQSAVVRHDVCGDTIKNLITGGHPPQNAPAGRPDGSALYDIADYLHRRIDEIDYLPQYGRAELEHLLVTGDATAGKEYFSRSGGCSGCHSPEGDLKGIATRYDAALLESRMISASGSKSSATVTLPSGQKLHGQLLSIDTFDVSIQDEAGWSHTWPRGSVNVEVQDPAAAHRALILKFKDVDVRNLLAYLETLK